MDISVSGTIMKNTASLLLGRLISRVFLFLLMIYAARTLGAEQYGVFSYALALVTLLAVTMDLGISRYIVQQLSRDPGKILIFLGGSLTVKGLLIVLGIALIVAISLVTGRDPETLIIIFMLAWYAALDSLSMTFTSIFEATQQMGYQAVLVSASNIVMSLFGILSLYTMPNLLVFSSVYVFGALLRLLLASWWCLRLYGRPLWTVDLDFYKHLLRQGIPFTLVTAFVTIYYYIDTIILSVYSGNEVVGYYNAAYRLLEAPLFLIAGVTTAIFPALSKLFVENKARLQAILSKSFQKALVFGSVISLVIAYFSDDLIKLLYGSAYKESGIVLSILVLSVAIIMPSTILGTAVRAIDKQVPSAWVTGFGAVLNICLNLIFIPRYSLLAAAWTTVFTEVFVLIVYAILVWRYIGPFFTVGYVFRWLAICSSEALFFYVTGNLGILYQLLIFTTMIVPVLLVSKVLDYNELTALLKMAPFRKRDAV